MKWSRIKTASEVKLSGIQVSVEYIDGSVRGVTLKDKDGNYARFCKEGYSDFSALVPSAPEVKKVHVLKGRYRDVVDINETFEHLHEAQDRHRELDHDSGLTITGCEVTAEPEATPKEMADIPF